MSRHRLTWVVIVLLLWVAAAVPAGSESPSSPAVDLFLQRLGRLLSGVSATPLRSWSSGPEVFFESSGLRLPAGELSFAGRLTVDPSSGGFDGVLERLALDGRRRLDLGRPTRIRGAPDGTVTIEGFEAAGPLGSFAGEGTFGPGGRLDASARLSGVDLYTLGLLFTTEPIASGTLDAELVVAGTPEAAAVRVSGRLDPGAGLPSIASVELQARWSSGTLEILTCEGLLGGSPFRLSGRVENVPDALERGSVDLSLIGDRLLLVRTDETLLRGDVELQVKGPAARLELAGRVVLNEGRYEGRLPQMEGLSGLRGKTGGTARHLDLFSLRTRPWREAVLGVDIVATAPLRVVTPSTRIAVRPDLRLTGTGETPVLIGRVDIEPGTVQLPGGRLEVSSGVLRFQPPDPSRPTLEIIGLGRMQGYDVTAVAEGPWDEPRVTLSSYPVLANEDLLLLVLTGQNPRAPKANEPEKSRNMNVAVALGKDMLSRVGGSGRASETTQSVMERFDVEVGRNVTRRGDETVHVLFRVADGVLEPQGTLFLSGERDVWGYYNGGVRLVFRFP